MSDLHCLPSGWVDVQLQDAVSIEYGKNLPVSKFTSEGYPVFGANGQIGFFSEYTREEPEILITCRGATCGTINVSRPKSFVTNNSMILSPISGDCLGKPFLRYALLAIDRSQLLTGSAQPQITINNLAPLRIRLAPIKEQQRIVAKIEELFSDLDAGVAALERAKANLKRYRAAVLKAAVEGKLTEAWRAENPDTEPASKLLERILAKRRQKWEADQFAKFAAAKKEPPKNWKANYIATKANETAPLAEFPRHWSLSRLDTVCQIIDCLHKTPVYSDCGFPMVRVTDVKDGYLNLSGARKVAEDVFLDFTRRYAPRRGDIIFSRVGTYGNVSYVNSNESFCLGQNTAILSPEINGRFLHYGLQSHFIKTQNDRAAVGTTQKTISLKSISALHVPVPPIAEQIMIVDAIDEQFSSIDQIQTEIERGLQLATHLRQSILKQAFEGKLVPQNPTDEPATALLTRLRAALSTSEINGKPRTPNRRQARRTKPKKQSEVEK